MIQKLRDMIGPDNAQAGLLDGRWVRVVPCPFYGGFFDRLNDAWAVLMGRVYAVRWPEPGELEDAFPPAIIGRPPTSAELIARGKAVKGAIGPKSRFA